MFFTGTKDRTPLLKSNVAYQFTRSAGNAWYIGKNERTLSERAAEHGGRDKNSAIIKHLQEGQKLYHIKILFNLFPSDHPGSNNHSSLTNNFYLETVRNKTSFLDTDKNWNLLLYSKEHITKKRRPIINTGLKARREQFYLNNVTPTVFCYFRIFALYTHYTPDVGSVIDRNIAFL